MALTQLRKDLHSLRQTKKIPDYQRFFKTGPGEYAEGDLFLGVSVPDQRRLAKKYRHLPWTETVTLLKSHYHEERLLALFILIHKFEDGDVLDRGRIYRLYLHHTRYINNWDLVDSSAHKIVGTYLQDQDRKILEKLAHSDNLWERRISIIATFHFIKQGDFGDSLKLAEILLQDPHDLIHKAVGWMLREIGNRDIKTERAFLDRHAARMPRTMLRYAIEKFPQPLRQKYLAIK
ncbi:MAG: DNA alkylation repair protein [Candidatus Omnitrophica bacterium]|nr:DNA alkylation repair protein [Candidatus Omnitrophota bacterium]